MDFARNQWDLGENSPLKLYHFGITYKPIFNAVVELRNSTSHRIVTVYTQNSLVV